jgi:hypothetical protein
MDLKKLPPSMLALLGLGCPGMQACLSPPVDSAETSTSEVESNTVGPCLSPPLDSSSGADTGSSSGVDTGSSSGSGSVGPCLSPPEETFGTDTDTSGDTGSSGLGSSGGSDTGSGTDGGSTLGPCLAPPGLLPDDTPDSLALDTSPAAPAGSRRAALERVLDRGVLPADVAARLRRASDLD